MLVKPPWAPRDSSHILLALIRVLKHQSTLQRHLFFLLHVLFKKSRERVLMATSSPLASVKVMCFKLFDGMIMNSVSGLKLMLC